jgi:glycosyltransferase involved in cell wall biosynthesis
MDRKLHILYIVQYFNHPDEPGGSRAYQFARCWTSRGHRVTVLTSNLNHKTLSSTAHAWADAGFSVIRLRTYNRIRGSFGRRILNFLSFAAHAFARAVWIRHVDIVYASSTPLTTGLAGYLVATVKRRPFYFEVRDLWPESAIVAGALKPGPAVRVIAWFERLFYRKATRVIAVHQGIRDSVIAKGKNPADVLFVPHGVDDWMLEVDPANPAEFPFDKDQHFICTYIGAHGRWNGNETILDAAHHLLGTRVRFLLIGDGDHKHELMRYARGLHLTNVHFLDPIPKRAIFDYLSQSHVALICAWKHEFHGMILANKVFDYLAAGCPVVAATFGQTEELLARADCGWSVPPEQPDRLAALLRDLSTLPVEDLRTRGVRGREFVRRHFLRSEMADQLQRVFVADDRDRTARTRRPRHWGRRWLGRRTSATG